MKTRLLAALAAGLLLVTLTACRPSPPEPTPIVIVITATPAPSLTPTAPTPPTETIAPTPLPPSPTAPPPTSTLPPPATAPSGPILTPGAPSGPYAVILVESNDVLNVRSRPGVNNPIVAAFPPTFTNVQRTGPSTRVDGALWVEVQRPGGGNGWVNAHYLTEYVAPAAFCSDGRVPALLNRLKTAVTSRDGDLLSALVSPIHGLDLMLWRHGTVANYTPAEARWVFNSTYKVNWGAAPGSGLDTIGAFREEPLPRLVEVFTSSYELHCNDVGIAAAFSLEPWPVRYANINFYNVLKPGSPGVELDWRLWLAGIEFVRGEPYLFALIHYQWEP